MQKNFTIHDFAELVLEGRAFDVHNLYGVTSIATDLAGRTATLRFQRDHRLPGPPDLPEHVTLRCSGRLRLAFNDLLNAPVALRDDAVDIAYYGAHCGWDEVLDEQLAADHGFEGLHISFSGGLVLRIRADAAEMAIG